MTYECDYYCTDCKERFGTERLVAMYCPICGGDNVVDGDGSEIENEDIEEASNV